MIEESRALVPLIPDFYLFLQSFYSKSLSAETEVFFFFIQQKRVKVRVFSSTSAKLDTKRFLEMGQSNLK